LDKQFRKTGSFRGQILAGIPVINRFPLNSFWTLSIGLIDINSSGRAFKFPFNPVSTKNRVFQRGPEVRLKGTYWLLYWDIFPIIPEASHYLFQTKFLQFWEWSLWISERKGREIEKNPGTC